MPAVPLTKEVVVIVKAGGAMVKDSVFVTVVGEVAESVTEITMLPLKVAVGVPVIWPVVALITNGAGRPVADQA